MAILWGYPIPIVSESGWIIFENFPSATTNRVFIPSHFRPFDGQTTYQRNAAGRQPKKKAAAPKDGRPFIGARGTFYFFACFPPVVPSFR